MAAGAKIGTAYVEVDADFSKLDAAIKAALRDAGRNGDRVGTAIEDGVQAGVAGAAQAARSGSADIEREGDRAGQGWAARFRSSVAAGADRARDAAASAMERLQPAMDKAGVAAGAALAVGFAGAVSSEKSNSKLKAQLGLSDADAKRSGKIAGELYAGAYGDSMEGVNEAVGAVTSSIKGMSKASDAQLKVSSQRALDYASTFDIDVTRAVGSVGTLMNTGLAKNSKQAFDLITRASQKVPASLREDVLDASDEYGQFFDTLGYSGEQAFSLLVKGTEKGAFGIDKIGDAVKEFTLLSTDIGSTGVQDAYKSIGLNAETMSNKILKGGKGAQAATQQIIDGLLKIKDPSEQAAASVALFGTPLEDLNKAEIPAFLQQLKGGGDAMKGFGGAADQMGKDLADNAGTRLETFKRVALMGIQDVAANYVIPAIDAIVTVAMPLAPLIGGITAAVVAYNVAAKALAIVQGVVNAVMAMSPWGLVALAIVGVVTAVVLLWKQSETFRDIVTAAWDAVKGATTALFDALQAAFTAIVTAVGTAWEAIRGATTSTWNAIAGVTTTVWTAITGFLKGLWDGIKTAVTLYFEAYRAVIIGVWNAVRSATSAVWEAIKTATAAVWAAMRAAADTAWEAIKTVILTPARLARDGLAIIWGNVKAAADTAWSALKTAASAAWNVIEDVILRPIRSARDALSDVWASIKSRAAAAWDGLKDGAASFAEGMKDKIVGAFSTAVKTVGGFINSIIGVINKIPGVEIPLIRLSADATRSSTGATATVPGFAKGGQFGPHAVHHDQVKRGARITRPMLIVGEEAPKDPEYTIPTNPAYRGRALGLFAELGGKLGVPGFATGGVFGQAMDMVTGALKGGVSGLLGGLPGVGMLPEWLQGTGTYALGKAKDWITDKIKSLFEGKAGRVANMIERMNEIDAMGTPYSYGGGHNASFSASRDIRGKNAVGWDCSGLVSALLHAGGFPGGVMSTDPLKTWGSGGDGDVITIGVRGSSGLGAHTMMRIGNKYAESGSGHGAQWVNGWSGNFPIHRHPAGFAQGGVYDEAFAEIISRAFDPSDPIFAGWGLAQGGTYPYVGAYETGGVVPQTGMALVHQGETITPADQVPYDVYVQIGDGPIERVLDARITKRDRATAGAARAGVR